MPGRISALRKTLTYDPHNGKRPGENHQAVRVPFRFKELLAHAIERACAGGRLHCIWVARILDRRPGTWRQRGARFEHAAAAPAQHHACAVASCRDARGRGRRAARRADCAEGQRM